MYNGRPFVDGESTGTPATAWPGSKVAAPGPVFHRFSGGPPVGARMSGVEAGDMGNAPVPQGGWLPGLSGGPRAGPGLPPLVRWVSMTGRCTTAPAQRNGSPCAP